MKALKALSLIIGVILCLVLVINILGYRSNVANGITGDEIKKVEMGMTLEQVISILGKPYEINNYNGQHDFSCKTPLFLEMSLNDNTDIIHIVDSFYNAPYCCGACKEDRQLCGKEVTLTYTKPVRLSKYYPMLWVHLDSNYCVRSVFAKRYEFIDDVCIYSLSWKKEETTLEEIQGETSLFINDELFNKCFKSKL